MAHRTRPAPFVILGAGAGGLAAASALRDAGYAGRVLLVSDERRLPSEGGTSRSLAWYRVTRIDLLLGARTERVDTARRTVVVRGHGALAYGRLIVDRTAVPEGAEPVVLAEDAWVAVISTADPSGAASEARAAVRRLLGIEPDPTHHHGW